MKINKKERAIIDRIKTNWRILTRNFMLSFETGCSIVGFVIAQFVWIWVLKGFLGWFVLWFSEVTNYRAGDVWQLTNLFWVLYGVWFFISIFVRLHIVDYKEEKLKEAKK